MGSILGRVIPKTFKMVLDTPLLNTQQYKVGINGKVKQSRERGCVPHTPRCSSYWKVSLLVSLDYGRQFYFPGNGVAPSPTPCCRSNREVSLLLALTTVANLINMCALVCAPIICPYNDVYLSIYLFISTVCWWEYVIWSNI